MWTKSTATCRSRAAWPPSAALAGTYTAYRTYFSVDVACGNLHTAILTVMEKNSLAGG